MTRCTCQQASRDARNAAFDEAAALCDEADAELPGWVLSDHIRALKTVTPSDIVKAGALHSEISDLTSMAATLREFTRLAKRIAELEDHLSQANDTIARMSRCQTAADLQREREAELMRARTAVEDCRLSEADLIACYEETSHRSATERPPTAPNSPSSNAAALNRYAGNMDPSAQARGCGEAWAWHAPDAGDVDA
jgi:uncharacterized coiled-coil protein SlyX